MFKYGVVQGRLTPQVGSFIQDFPIGWRNEFISARDFGVSHIEWICGAPNYPSPDPLIGLDPSMLEVPISAVCFDWLPRETLHDWMAGLNVLLVLQEMETRGLDMAVVPLLEASSLVRARDLGVLDDVTNDVRLVCDAFPGIRMSFETDLEPRAMATFLSDLDGLNVGVTFDTGNLTRLGHDLNEHLDAYLDRIDNVHVKDCMRGGTTVPLGTGDTDLSVLRRLLSASGVRFMTFQSARGPGDERETFMHNVRTMEAILDG